MYDPDSYDAYSAFQRRDCRELVPHLVSKMSFKKSEKILDFGCGSGYNTLNILLPNLLKKSASHPGPGGKKGGKLSTRKSIQILDENNNFVSSAGTTSEPSSGPETSDLCHIYGVDISKKMVDFASEKYVNGQITYMVADVLKEECEFPCKFDKIFSFHVLHWIKDQKRALEQLYGLLNAGGEVGLYYISTGAVFSVYELISKLPQFAPFLQDVKNFIPKSHYSADPAADVHDTLSSIGYHVQETRNCLRKFTFPNVDSLIDAAMAANPFIHRIPLELQDEYKFEFRNIFQQFIRSTSEGVEVDYEIVVFRAKRVD